MAYVFTKQCFEQRYPLEQFTVVQAKREDVADEISSAHVAIPLMCRLDESLITKARNLRLIIQYGVGVEGIDIDFASRRGIYVANIASRWSGNAASCAEMAIFLSLALLRKFNELRTSIQIKRLGMPMGEMLQGKHVLIVGFGNIAKELCLRLDAFGCKVSAFRKSDVWGEEEDDLAIRAEKVLRVKGVMSNNVELECVLSQTDIVILTCVLDDGSRGLVDDTFISMCKKGVKIVNVARGGLINYEAACRGLESGKIGGMGLDVQWYEPFDPSDPLTTHEKVVMTPHVAGVTDTSYKNMGEIVMKESTKVLLDHSAPEGCINAALL